MKKYVFIIGRKIDDELDLPRLSQCYTTEEYAEAALEDLKEKHPASYESGSIISNEQQLEALPDDCYYIRAMEVFQG